MKGGGKQVDVSSPVSTRAADGVVTLREGREERRYEVMPPEMSSPTVISPTIDQRQQREGWERGVVMQGNQNRGSHLERAWNSRALRTTPCIPCSVGNKNPNGKILQCSVRLRKRAKIVSA